MHVVCGVLDLKPFLYNSQLAKDHFQKTACKWDDTIPFYIDQ